MLREEGWVWETYELRRVEPGMFIVAVVSHGGEVPVPFSLRRLSGLRCVALLSSLAAGGRGQQGRRPSRSWRR